MVKKRERTAPPTEEQIDAFAKQADTTAPAKEDKSTSKVSDKQKAVTRSISLPLAMYNELEDLAFKNKREGKPHRTISSIVKAALDNYL